MTDEKMRLELKENNVTDNPFDVLLYQSMELTRDLLFACHRLRDPEVVKGTCINLKGIEEYADNIKNEFGKLLNISDETLSMCKETSYYYDQDEFDKLNEYLFEFETRMETICTRGVPSRNDRFDQIRLGKDSDEYKRMLELRKLVTESELSSVSDEYLYSLIDILYNSYEANEYSWFDQKDFKEKELIIEKYHLTEEDIIYMISYMHQIK